jgi:predicted TIM-barrel fold metal-dependent hydrolase
VIIDSHSHWLPPEIIDKAHFFSRAWGDVENHLKMMDEAGIDKAVLTYPTSDAHLRIGSISRIVRFYNDNLARIIKRYPDRFIAAAIVPVNDARRMVDELKRMIQEFGFKALSLASSYNGKYLDDEMFWPIYKYAQENKIPIFVHSQIINPIGYSRVKDPLLTPVIEFVFDTTVCIGRLLMADILRQYPQVKFIFAYFGGVICHLAGRFDATYQMLRGINFVKDLQGAPSDYLKNIYVDTSGDKNRTNFLAALELLGPRHLLWGSDWPAKKDVSGAIQAIKDLGITQEDKENILGGNLERILQ